MTDGRVLAAAAHAAKGTPEAPLTLPDLRAKYELCAAGRLTEADAAELFDLLARIDELEDLGRLFELMRSARPRPALS